MSLLMVYKNLQVYYVQLFLKYLQQRFLQHHHILLFLIFSDNKNLSDF